MGQTAASLHRVWLEPVWVAGREHFEVRLQPLPVHSAVADHFFEQPEAITRIDLVQKDPDVLTPVCPGNRLFHEIQHIGLCNAAVHVKFEEWNLQTPT